MLPALWAAWGGHDGAARPLGDLSAANTFGAIAGALAAGFVAVPLLGVRGTLLVAAVGYIVLADVIAPPHSRLRPLAYAALLAVVIANPLRMPLVHLRPGGGDVARGGGRAERHRHRRRQTTAICSCGSTTTTCSAAAPRRPTSAASVWCRCCCIRRRTASPSSGSPPASPPAPRPALGVDETTVVELVPEVATRRARTSPRGTATLLERPDVRLVLDDGRRYLAATRDHFDVIVSDLFIPWHAGAGSLYSREMYETVARRLAPGGLFCQWLPLYQLTRDEFDMIARTFLAVFPQVSLWRADFYPNRPVVGLVGQFSAQPVDLTRVGERLDRLPAWSRDPLLAAPRGLAMLSAGPLTPVADLFAAAPLNTDDRPLLEFIAPRLTRINAAGDKDWFTGEALAAFYDTLATRASRTSDPLLPASEQIAEARRAGNLLYRYALAATNEDTIAAARLEAEVRALVPEVIQSAESADGVTDLAEARRTLAGLRSEQEQVRHRLEEMEQRLGQLSRSGEDVQ